PLGGRPLVFFGIALDDNGVVIPVMHSDTAFSMLYSTPPAEYLPILTRPFRLPWPWGLDSPAGEFVATSAYAGQKIQKWFTMKAYHGGVWSFMQELETASLTIQR